MDFSVFVPYFCLIVREYVEASVYLAADSVVLSRSFSRLPPDARLCMVIQGHPRSMMFQSVESKYASY